MVGGIDKFRAYFKGHEDQYAVIGGAACALLFDQAGVPFRATRDIDMVLCVEVVDAAFGTALRKFLEDGQTLKPGSFGVRMTRADGITVLRAAYGLE